MEKSCCVLSGHEWTVSTVALRSRRLRLARGMIQLYRALGGGWQLRLDQLAASGQCCKPLPSVVGGECDDYIGKQPPAGFDAWCIWPEWLRGHKPR
jgi:hypothetical protein